MTTDSIAPENTDSCTHQKPAACLSRRRALAGFAGVGIGLPVLAACGGSDSGSTATDPVSSAAGTPSGASTPTAAASESASSGGAAAPGLVSTADIEVGGGEIFADENVVITQPTEGEFKGFSATCTHQGCTVGSVEDGMIICPCHNSEFSIEDGEPQSGPASSPLEEVALTVTGDQISLA